MNSTKQHKKVRLSGNNDCCVVHCSECDVLELNFGASLLRISPESLHTISSILNNANVRPGCETQLLRLMILGQ